MRNKRLKSAGQMEIENQPFAWPHICDILLGAWFLWIVEAAQRF